MSTSELGATTASAEEPAPPVSLPRRETVFALLGQDVWALVSSWQVRSAKGCWQIARTHRSSVAVSGLDSVLGRHPVADDRVLASLALGVCVVRGEWCMRAGGVPVQSISASQLWMGTVHRSRTLEDGLSAYSVFNPFQVRLAGTLTAEDLTSQMMGLIPRATDHHVAVGSSLALQEAAQSERELQAALQASLHDTGPPAAAPHGGADEDDDPMLRAAIEASLRER
jgi:hypothetical protein